MSANITGLNASLQGSTGTNVVARWTYTGSTVTVKVYASKKTYTTKTVSAYNQISSFKIQWQYYQDGNWYVGDETTDYSKDSTQIAKTDDGTKYQVVYSAPAEATKVRVRVYCGSGTYNKVTGKKKKYKGVSTAYFTASWSSWVTYDFSTNAPDAPSISSLTSTGTTIKAVVTTDSADNKTNQIRFEYSIGGTVKTTTSWMNITNHYLEYAYAGLANSTYRVRAQAKNTTSGGTSVWGGYSEVSTVPATPTNFKASAGSEEGVIILDWDDVPGVSEESGYTVEYTNNKTYFDASSNVQSASSTASTMTLNVDLGYTWYFRVRATNSAGNSSWSKIIQQVIAKVPEAPTTWTNKSSFMTGENIRLYFTHNSEDNSKLQEYKISYKVNGVQQPEITETPPQTTEDNPIYYYDLDVSSYSADTVILWKIRTKGVHPDYGKYSMEREIKIYVQPALNIEIDETITQFPIDISLTTTPLSQKPINYAVSIVSTESYTTSDMFGNETFVNADTTVYSKIFINTDNSNTLDFSILPSEAALEQGQTYNVYATVSMNSGLVAEDSVTIDTEWDTELYFPEADIEFNEDQYTCAITPVCYKIDAPYEAVVAETTYTEEQYSFNDETFIAYVDEEHGNYPFIYENGWTYNNSYVDISDYGLSLSEEVIPKNGDQIIVTYEMEQILEEDVVLDVYRKNTDATFTEIITNMTNSGNSVTTDPHPNFGVSSYRIIARNPYNNSIGYNDIDVENNVTSIVIQWDEKYSIVEDVDVEALDIDAVDPIYSGSIIVLPYNIKTSESNSKDVSLVEYIGRKHPVTYYGTQRGSKASWNADIEKTDKEKINLLRALDVWPEDVYVREPNGTGYKASVSVSFNIDYDSLIIPVSIDVTHVE